MYVEMYQTISRHFFLEKSRIVLVFAHNFMTLFCPIKYSFSFHFWVSPFHAHVPINQWFSSVNTLLLLWWNQLWEECSIPRYLQVTYPNELHMISLPSLLGCISWQMHGCQKKASIIPLAVSISMSLYRLVIFVAQAAFLMIFFFLSPYHQPPSHFLRVSSRQWLRTSEAFSAVTPVSLIHIWKRKPSPTPSSSLVA